MGWDSFGWMYETNIVIFQCFDFEWEMILFTKATIFKDFSWDLWGFERPFFRGSARSKLFSY